MKSQAATLYVVYNIKSHKYLTFTGKWTDDRAKSACWTLVDTASKRLSMLTPIERRECIVTER